MWRRAPQFAAAPSGGPGNYCNFWVFGDGTTSNEANPSHAYPDSGTYPVRLVVNDGVSEDEFVKMRRARDAVLEVPTLILPSIQVNIRAGQFPPAEDDGVSYLKIPLNVLGQAPRTNSGPAADSPAGT